jgi:type I restriction enzyme, S subunit
MLLEYFQDTSIGPLPIDWEIKPLESVVLKTETRNPSTKPNELFKYIDISSVSNETYKIIGWKDILGQNAPSRARKVVRRKDIIFATVRPYLKNIAQIPDHLDNEICSTGYCVIRAIREQVDPDFLYNVCISDSFVDSIVSQQRGSSYPAVSDQVVLNTFIPIPPLPEQRAIAHVLSTVRRSIEASERVIAAARELKRSLMKYLFTYGPVAVDQAEGVKLKETEVGLVPEEWEVVKLGEFCEFTQYGTSKRCTTLPIGYPVLRIPNVIGGRIDISDLKFTEMKKPVAEKILLENGDVIFVRTNGQRAFVGRSAVFKNQLTNALFASYLIRIRLLPGSFLPDFVQSYTETGPGMNNLSGRATGASDGKFNINSQTIKTVIIPKPSINVQKKIVELIQICEDKIDIEQNRRASIETLFNSLLHNLMTGKVRVRDLPIPKSLP